jgi:pyrroline-5-carboxylate reductase
MTETTIFSRPAWLAGSGNMGSALVEGWRNCGYDLTYLTVIRPSGKAVEGARVVGSVEEAGSAPRFIILAMKPNQLATAAAQLRPHLSSDTILISVLAGVQVSTLRKHFPGIEAVVRAMPNLGVAVRRGVTGLVGDRLDAAAEREVAAIFQPLGFALWAADEDRLAAIGAVAGAGPAYVARFMAALAKAGEGLGLSPELASLIAVETTFGAAWLAAANKEPVETIAKRVASPKGTTEAGLAVLDNAGALDALVNQAIQAAARRGNELGKEIDGAMSTAEPTLH